MKKTTKSKITEPEPAPVQVLVQENTLEPVMGEKSFVTIFFLFLGLALNCFLLYMYLSLWISPKANDIEMIRNLSVLIIFEFFLVHSRPAMGLALATRNWAGFLMLVLIFGMFALLFNMMVKGNLILVIYGAVILNRILPEILPGGKAEMDRGREILENFLCLFIYCAVFIIMFLGGEFISFIGLENFFKFGLTDDFLASVNYKGSAPHEKMCFGVLYYLGLTFVDIFKIKIWFKLSKNIETVQAE